MFADTFMLRFWIGSKISNDMHHKLEEDVVGR